MVAKKLPCLTAKQIFGCQEVNGPQFCLENFSVFFQTDRFPGPRLKGHGQLWDRADLDTSFLTLKKNSPQPEIKAHVEFHFNLRSVLLDFQSFTEKLVFEGAFAHPVLNHEPWPFYSLIVNTFVLRPS